MFRKKRRKWIHAINAEWQKYGEYHTLVPELREDEEWFWMTTDCYDGILNIIKDDIMKENKKYHTAISPGERAVITLRNS